MWQILIPFRIAIITDRRRDVSIGSVTSQPAKEWEQPRDFISPNEGLSDLEWRVGCRQFISRSSFYPGQDFHHYPPLFLDFRFYSGSQLGTRVAFFFPGIRTRKWTYMCHKLILNVLPWRVLFSVSKWVAKDNDWCLLNAIITLWTEGWRGVCTFRVSFHSIDVTISH